MPAIRAIERRCRICKELASNRPVDKITPVTGRDKLHDVGYRSLDIAFLGILHKERATTRVYCPIGSHETLDRITLQHKQLLFHRKFNLGSHRIAKSKIAAHSALRVVCSKCYTDIGGSILWLSKPCTPLNVERVDTPVKSQFYVVIIGNSIVSLPHRVEVALDVVVRQAIEAGAIGAVQCQRVVVGIGRGCVWHYHSIPVIDFEFRQGKSQVVAIRHFTTQGTDNRHTHLIGDHTGCEQLRCKLIILGP